MSENVQTAAMPGAPAIEAAAAEFRRALQDGDSVLTPGRPIWTAANAEELLAKFNGRPDISGANFEEKLARQLADASPDAVQLFAELYSLDLLPLSDYKPATKRSLGQMIKGVQVVAATHEGTTRAYTSHWVTQVAFEEPIVMASVNLDLDGDKVSAARIILYGVAPIPWKSEAAEKAIIGKTISPETAGAAGDAAIEAAKPLSMNAYKVPLTKTVVKRALLAAIGNRYWEV